MRLLSGIAQFLGFMKRPEPIVQHVPPSMANQPALDEIMSRPVSGPSTQDPPRDIEIDDLNGIGQIPLTREQLEVAGRDVLEVARKRGTL